MQTEVIKEFLIKIGMSKDTTSFQKFDGALKTTSMQAANLATNLKTNLGGAADAVGASFISMHSKILLGLGGLTYIAHGVFESVEKTAEKLENLNKLSGRLNSSATQIEKLSFVASITGSSAAAAQSSLEGLARQAGNTYMGIGRFSARVFKQLHISVKDSNGQLKNTYDLMFEIGQKIKGLQAGQQIAILSKLGIDPTLVKVLTEDTSEKSDRFDKLYSGAGINLDEAAKSSEEFADNLKTLKYELGSIAQVGTLAIMDKLSESLNLTTETFIDNLPRIRATAEPIINLVITATGTILKYGYKLLQWASYLIRTFSSLNKETNGIAAWSLGASYALSKLGTIIKHGPLGAVLLLIGAISWLQDDFKKFNAGISSTIDWNSTLGRTIVWLGQKAKEFAPTLISVSIAFYAVRTAVAALDFVLAANPIGFALAAIGVALAILLPVIIANWDRISSVFTTSIDWIVSKIDWLTDKLKGVANFADDVRQKSIDGLNLDHTFNFMHSGDNKAIAISPKNNGGDQNINQNTTIHVTGNDSPQGTANAVLGHQKRVNADLTRNSKAITR